jgi:hypothetical protein
MATTTTTTNKPLNPRAQDLSPKGYNRAALFSGKALSFDGVNDNVSVNFNTAHAQITYAVHIKAVLGTDRCIFQKEGAVRLIRVNSNQLQFVLATGSNAWYSKTITIPSIDDRACFFTATYDGATLSVYIDGKLISTLGGFSGSTLNTGFDFAIGSSGLSSLFYNGTISGFKVFNTALTPAQVADLYLNPEKITQDGVATSALKLWLPMMEGAGASAYDGSGNGNDGTINGATWTAGVGAPVAQTALVSWNKGQNLVRYSEQFDNAYWSKTSSGSVAPVVTANNTTAPNGTTTAERIVFPAVSTADTYSLLYNVTPAITSGASKFSVWLKGSVGGEKVYIFPYVSSYTSVLCTLTTEWQEFSASFTGGGDTYIHIGIDLRAGSGQVAQSGSTIYAWGASVRPTSAGDAYIKTNATAQTSAVLVPEGLTAGASIFGTDIITPRNAFALNLDGVSYASVNDNASVDLTTGATLEAWVLIPDVPAVTDSGIISKYTSSGSFIFTYRASGIELGFAAYFHGGGALVSSFAINYVPSYGSWVHVVGTFAGSTAITTYVNGVQASQNTSGIPASITQSALNVEIGRWQGAARGNLRVANPRIYNRALTAAEVLRNYNADKAKFGL